MPRTQNKALATYRRKLKRQGIIRIELLVREEDAGLVRSVAHALADPARQTQARALLRERFGGSPHGGLKALLAAAPLDGIDLSRDRDGGRNVDL